MRVRRQGANPAHPRRSFHLASVFFQSFNLEVDHPWRNNKEKKEYDNRMKQVARCHAVARFSAYLVSEPVFPICLIHSRHVLCLNQP